MTYFYFRVRDIQALRSGVQLHTISWWQNRVQDDGRGEGWGKFSESGTGWTSPRDVRNLALFSLLQKRRDPSMSVR